MVFVKDPKPVSPRGSWEDYLEDALLKVQRNTSTLLPKSGVAKRFRILTANPCVELAVGNTQEEISIDVDVLTRFIAGIVPEDPDLVPEKVKVCLAEAMRISAQAAHEEAAGGSGSTSAAALREEWKAANVIKQLEPWARQLLEHSDKMRYVCYALKVATSATAEGSTLGLGGEELVQTAFISVDAAILGSWLTWFTSSLLDNSEASNVVQKTLAINFDGGPRAIAAQADAICASLRPEDAEPVTKLALSLKRRVAVLIGDVCSLFIPNDLAIGGVVITEMLTRIVASDASEGLRKLVAWYELISTQHRAYLEDSTRLTELLQLANEEVHKAVVYEYEKPLARKAGEAALRQLVLIPIPGSVLGNTVLTGCLCNNVGKQSCDEVFATVHERMPEIAAVLQKALSIAFGTLILLAHAADRADAAPTQGPGGNENKIGWSAEKALEVLPAVLEFANKSGGSKGSKGSISFEGAVGAVTGALKLLSSGSKASSSKA